MRGHSVSEVILSQTEIDYTGIESPAVVIALAAEGVQRCKKMFSGLSANTLVIKSADLQLPPCPAQIVEVDLQSKKIKSADRALAALAVLAGQKKTLTLDMLKAALKLRFKKEEVFQTAIGVVEKAAS